MRRKPIVFVGLLVAAVVAISAKAQNPVGASTSVPQPIKVLLIGNSYIYVNNLPGILAALGNSPESPRKIRANQVTIAGGTLEQLWAAGLARNAIQAGYDYVVLQEASTTLMSDPLKTAEFARLFDTEIRKSGATTILFSTWAHKAHRAAQPSMDRSIDQIARDLGAQVAPVGLARSIAESIDPSIGLYWPDETHPTLIGSYLAACTLYLTLMRDERSCPVVYAEAMSGNDVTVVRNASFQAVHGSTRP